MPVRHRLELVTASIHWAHLEHAIDLCVTPLDGGRATVECQVTDFGDYWEPYPTPRVATLTLAGTLSLDDACCRVAFSEGPLSELSFDPRVPRRELLLGPWSDAEPPAFCRALLAWARST